MKYVDLHVHTEASYRDAVNTVPEVFERTKELGRNAVAITDHGNMARMFKALRYATKMQKKAAVTFLLAVNTDKDAVSGIEKTVDKAFGDFGSVSDPDAPKALKELLEKNPGLEEAVIANSVKYIPGIEMYTHTDNDPDSRCHIILLGKDWQGMKALFKMCNLAQLDKTGKKNDMPRLTMESLNRFVGPGTEGHGHVIGTSACMQGHICETLLKPYWIREKSSDYQRKLDNLPHVFPADTLDKAQQEIDVTAASLKEAKDELNSIKAIAGKKVESKITRLQAKIEKLEAKSADTTEELGQLDVLLNEQASVNEANARMVELKPREEMLKMRLSTLKTAYAEKEKAMRQQLKLQRSIAELEEKASMCVDVYAKAKELAVEYDRIFGHGNYYLELQKHGIAQEDACSESLIKISRETGIPLTVANDCHFCHAGDAHKRSIIAAMRFDKRVSEVEQAPGQDQLYFKSDDEMLELFPEAPEAYENTLRIADMCNVFYHKEMHLPTYEDTKGRSPEKYLLESSREGFKFRYPDYPEWSKEKKKEFGDRVKYELGVIHKMGYDSYIAIVRDFIFWARENCGRTKVGPGRGSGAGSLVNYLLQITDIDPMRYNLVFERFLNPERVSMPDIDTDFAPSIRADVVQYVSQRYAYTGEYPDSLKSTVVNIATEGTLKARAAIRGVGRVEYGDSALPLCDKLAKLVPEKPGITIDSVMESSEELKKMYATNPMAKRIIDDARLVENIPINSGVHAAGVIIADKPVTEYSPMFYNDKKDCWVIQYDMIAAENDIGLLKMDFLGLKNLDIIDAAAQNIELAESKTVDFDKLKLADDGRVIANIYATGDTDGVFQFESGGMKKTLQSFRPTSIDDVILLNAAYRPGPMDFIPDITSVKNGVKSPSYLVPEMQKILGVTYGSAIYQEQIMELFQMVGYSLGQSDIIRRAMSKKHLNEIMAEKDRFEQGMIDKGAKPEDVEKFWTQLLAFASYAFNKAHAAAYSVVSYYTAWLKFYYPTEYMCALLQYSPIEKYAQYTNDAMHMGVQTLPPDINRSLTGFSPVVEDGQKAILFGLESVKGVASHAETIIKERELHGEYTSFVNFIARAVLSRVAKAPIVALIKVGAFNQLNSNRKLLADSCEEMYNRGSVVMKRLLKKNRLEGAKLVADTDEEEVSEENIVTAEDAEEETVLPVISYEALLSEIENASSLMMLPSGPDYDHDMRIRYEKDLMGLFISGHPLDGHTLPADTVQISNLPEEDGAQSGNAAGFIDNVKMLARKKDGAAMARFTLGDRTGDIEVVAFVNVYAQYKDLVYNGSIVKITGKMQVERDDEDNVTRKSLVASKIERID